MQRAGKPVKQFVGAVDLLHDSFELGRQVAVSSFRPTVVVGLLRGGAAISIAVHEVLEYRGLHCTLAAIRASAYTHTDQKCDHVSVYGLEFLASTLVPDDSLLLVDDVFETGDTIAAFLAQLNHLCGRDVAKEIRTATVYFKPHGNRRGRKPDYYIHETDKWLVFPHELKNLTAAEILENKPAPPGLI